MSLSKLTTNYASFNEWANTTIVQWLKTVDSALLYKQTLSSFTSIDYTLQHMLRTQNFWVAFINEQDTSKINWAIRENEVEKIMNEILISSEKLSSVCSSFTEESLETTLHLNMPWAKNNLSRYEYIIHIVNHSTFHRGQIITMARSLGMSTGIPNTDYNIFNCR